MRSLHRRPSRVAIGTATAVFVLVGVPLSAYAAAKNEVGITVDGNAWSAHRTPSNEDDDLEMSARSAGHGTVYSNIDSCPNEDAAYNWSLRHDRWLRPDTVMFTEINIHYCWVERQIQMGWPEGNYHFNIGNYYIGQPNGTGNAGMR